MVDLEDFDDNMKLDIQLRNKTNEDVETLLDIIDQQDLKIQQLEAEIREE